jgi:cytoskeletal protein RodZ
MKNSTIFTLTLFAAGALIWFTVHEEDNAFKRARLIPVAHVEVSDTSEISKPFEVQTRSLASVAYPHTTTAPATVTHGPTQIEVGTDTTTTTEGTALNLHLNEEILGAMEHAGADLRQYAAAEPTGAGWRIQLYPADKVFAKAGFHNGDVVTFAGLQARSDNSQQARLAERMVDILRMIER